MLDFYCDEVRLAVEIDGAQHTLEERGERDAQRDAWVAAQGVETLRIPAIDVLTELDGVLRFILEVARRRRTAGDGRRRERSRS